MDDEFPHFDVGLPVLDKFRSFARGHVDDFLAARDRVLDLVGGSQRLISGLAREDLLRQFLRQLLPSDLSVDSGIVYGFEQVANSNQIDVLVWDSARNPPVFRGESFVVLAPESVIAAVSVKTRSGKADIHETTENLASLAPLDLAFRAPSGQPPIAKIGFFYSPVADRARTCQWVADGLRSALLEADEDTLQRCQDILASMDPVNPDQADTWHFERLLPRMFVHLGDPGVSFVRGWGPPGLTAVEAAAQPLRRRPYVYPQTSSFTSPLEKLAYHILSESMRELGSKGWSIVSAWGDFHPQYHFKVGDAGELIEVEGVEVIDDGFAASKELGSKGPG